MKHTYGRADRIKSTKPEKRYLCAKQLRPVGMVCEVTGEKPPQSHNYLRPADPQDHGGYGVFNAGGAVGPFLWYENACATRAKVGGRVVRWKDIEQQQSA